MRLQYYVDFKVLNGEMALPIVSGAIIKVLHGVFADQAKYAIAFPGNSIFSIIRIFASNRDDLDELVAKTAGHLIIQNYAQIGYPRMVPADFNGPWVEYRRFRIPTRKADRDQGAPLRAKRIKIADESKLPYLILTSKSTKQQFGLYFQVLKTVAGISEARPNSYGLSSALHSFSVPDLP